MKSILVLATWISTSALALMAQTASTLGSAPAIHEHSVGNSAVIDGATHPELIPDPTAYRLFFISIASSTTDSPADKMGHQAHLGRMHFQDADQRSFIGMIQTFRAEYDKLVQAYNQDAAAALAAGSIPDISSFLKKRDALVQGTRDQLKLTLSADGLTRLDTVVSSEKQHMKMQHP